MSDVVPAVWRGEGTASELSAELARLRRAVRLRTFTRGAMLGASLALLCSMFVMASMDRGEPLAAIVAAVVVLFLRPRSKPWLAARAAFAGELVRELRLEPTTRASLKLDLGETERPELASSVDPDGSMLQGKVERRFYANEWLTLRATLADGASVRIARSSRVQRNDPVPEAGGRRPMSMYGRSAVDDVEITFPEVDAYRVASVGFTPERAATLVVPDKFEIVSFEIEPRRARLVVRSFSEWEDRGERTGACADTLRWLEALYDVAGADLRPS